MQARTMILAVLVGGPLAGVLMGLAADPKMVPPPAPAWRSARPDPIVAEPQPIVEPGPQDLSPTWYLDRMPTWKRRAAEREAAAYEAVYAEPASAEPPAPPPEIEPAVFDEAAGAPAAGRDAAASAGAEAKPALSDRDEPAPGPVAAPTL